MKLCSTPIQNRTDLPALEGLEPDIHRLGLNNLYSTLPYNLCQLLAAETLRIELRPTEPESIGLPLPHVSLVYSVIKYRTL